MKTKSALLSVAVISGLGIGIFLSYSILNRERIAAQQGATDSTPDSGTALSVQPVSAPTQSAPPVAEPLVESENLSPDLLIGAPVQSGAYPYRGIAAGDSKTKVMSILNSRGYKTFSDNGLGRLYFNESPENGISTLEVWFEHGRRAYSWNSPTR